VFAASCLSSISAPRSPGKPADVRHCRVSRGHHERGIVRRSTARCRVARGSYPPPAPTEPDLWASHPALRDIGVGELNRLNRCRPQPAAIPARVLTAQER
jgi:hypothetical protein